MRTDHDSGSPGTTPNKPSIAHSQAAVLPLFMGSVGQTELSMPWATQAKNDFMKSLEGDPQHPDQEEPF